MDKERVKKIIFRTYFNYKKCGDSLNIKISQKASNIKLLKPLTTFGKRNTEINCL